MADIIANKDENTVILYEDEATPDELRGTSEPTTTAVWTKKGHQGIVKTSGETRKRVVVYGAASSRT